MPKPLLLAVDDEPEQIMFLQDFFESTHEVHTAADVPSALALIADHAFDVALVDYRMPGGTGMMILRRLADQNPQCRRYLLSATDILNTERAKEPPYAKISKGIDPRELIRHVLSGNLKDT